jgi:hypothetical protein
MAPPRGGGGGGAEEEEKAVSETLTADSVDYECRRGSSSSSETASTVSFSYSPPEEWQPVAIKTCVSADVNKEEKPAAPGGGDDDDATTEKHRASGTTNSSLRPERLISDPACGGLILIDFRQRRR